MSKVSAAARRVEESDDVKFHRLLAEAKMEGKKSSVAFYRQGKALSRIYRETGWERRYGSRGKMLRELGKELRISHMSVWYRIIVAEGASEADVEKHGFQHMRLYIQASEIRKPALWMEMQKGRMTYREVAWLSQTPRSDRVGTSAKSLRLVGNGLEGRFQFTKSSDLDMIREFLVKYAKRGEASGDALVRLVRTVKAFGV
jgi:hypothetical protein